MSEPTPTPQTEPQVVETPQLQGKTVSYVPVIVLAAVAIALLLVPLLNVALAVTALILAIRARRKNARLGDTTKLGHFTVVLSSVATGIAVISTATVIIVGSINGLPQLAGIISTVSDSAQKNSDYGERVAAYEAKNKTFSVGQTMQYGPVDVTAVGVVRNYQPSAEVIAYLDKRYEGDSADQDRGYSLANGEYVYVTVKASYDASREGADRVTFDSSNFVEMLNGAQLDDASALMYWVGDTAQPLGRLDTSIVKTIKAGGEHQLTYLYKIPAGSTATPLTYDVGYYTRVSSIVGTEGMPTKLATYSLALE